MKEKLDEEVVLGKKAQLENGIKEAFRSLMRLDRQRASYLQNYAASSTPWVGLPEFGRVTGQSIVELQLLEKLFLQLLGVVLLLKDEGHQNSDFNLLLTRYELMEKLFSKLRKIRKKQIKLISSLIRFDPAKNRTATHKIIIYLFVRRLKKSLRKEREIISLMGAYYEKDSSSLLLLKKTARLEEIKEMALRPLQFGSLLAPGAIIWLILIDEIYQLINTYTANYKRLIKILK